MRLGSINTYPPTYFKANLGFDDEISQDRRAYIREHYQKTFLPYQDIFEKEKRLDEYSLKNLVSKFTNKKFALFDLKNLTKNEQTLAKSEEKITKSVNHELMKKVPLFNVQQITGTNSYRGACPIHYISSLKMIKDAGIETIIDLVGEEEVENQCRKYGLKYFALELDICPFIKNPFKSKEDILNPQTQPFVEDIQNYTLQLYDIPDYGEAQASTNFKLKRWKKDVNEFIPKFIEFINTMQKDFVYIGCDWGTYTTNNALLLNSFFNPKMVEAKIITGVDCYNEQFIFTLEKLYQNLTQKHKTAMGWTKEMDKKFIPYLRKYYK